MQTTVGALVGLATPPAAVQRPGAHAGGGVAPALGIYTEFESNPSRTVSNMRESEASGRRVLRYVLQSAVRELLPYKHRTRACLRYSRSGPVEVYHQAARKSTHYGNLMVCGSHWVCLPCAVKIASRRVVEVQQAVELVQQHGGTVLFATNTVPHYVGQHLPTLLDTFLKAVRSLKTSRAYRELVLSAGFLGEIRSLEVTHGENGWHPHTHSLLFLDAQIDLGAFQGTLKSLWASVVLRHRLGAVHDQYGLNLQEVGQAIGEDSYDTAGYVVKVGEELDKSLWGPADELVRGNAKQGRWKGRTPFSLLADYALLEDTGAGSLFKHYARAFKGKNHLRWSRGLRDQLGLSPQLSDLEVAEQQTDEADLLGILDREQWASVLASGRGARGELLELARSGDWSQVLAWLEPLQQSYMASLEVNV